MLAHPASMKLATPRTMKHSRKELTVFASMFPANSRSTATGIRSSPFGQLSGVSARRTTPAMNADTFARIHAQYLAVCKRTGMTQRAPHDTRALLEELLEGEPERERVKRRVNFANRTRSHTR